jgi:hypothetical protein
MLIHFVHIAFARMLAPDKTFSRKFYPHIFEKNIVLFFFRAIISVKRTISYNNRFFKKKSGERRGRTCYSLISHHIIMPAKKKAKRKPAKRKTAKRKPAKRKAAKKAKRRR